MHGYEEPVVALTDRGAHTHHAISSILIPASPFFHIDNHLLEGIGFLFDLPAANRWQ